MNSEDYSCDVVRKLHAYLKNDRCSVETLKTLLAGMDSQKRKQILNERVNNNTLVTLTCERNRLDLVQYFITECGLDVNALQEFQYFSEACSMLCWACRSLKQDLVELLLQNGAATNFSCKSGKGPLHYVCSLRVDSPMTGLSISKIIKLLVDNGAIVDGKSCTGETPLMFACMRYNATEACKTLISRCADVNAVDDSGDSPLHYHCSRYSGCGNVEILKVLLESGANTDRQNERNQSPPDILIKEWCDDYTMFRRFKLAENYIQMLLDNIALKNKYHMLEIFGAMFALNGDDVEYSVRLWQQAYLLKSEFPHLECCTNTDGNILSDIQECERVEQFEHLKLTDRTAVLKQAMVKSYRHFEFNNNLTLILCRALLDFYMTEKCYDKGQNIFTQLLDFITEDEGQTKLILTNSQSLERLMKTFVSYWFRILKHLECPEYEYSFKLISFLLKLLERRGLNTPLDPCYGYWVINFLKHFTGSGLQLPREACKVLHTFIQYNMRFDHPFEEGDLVHLVCVGYSESKMSTLKTLLQHGMTANAVDSHGNTALHKCLLRRRQPHASLLSGDQLLNLLINNTHMDIPNNEGVTPLDLLARHTTKHPLDYITLKCLAARVISHHKIHYVGILPKPLEAFVVMH